MSLEELFSGIVDPRRGQGRRTQINQIFCMVTISYLCGYYSYRQMASFCKSYEGLFRKQLGLKHAIPSYVTFRDVLTRVNQEALIAAFNAWCADFVSLPTGSALSGDGKSLNSTLTHKNMPKQDYQSVVSFFAQQSGMVTMIAARRQNVKGASEIQAVQAMLNELKDKGLIICLDAIHTQKKQLT
jgi:hypothetical protein